MKANPSRKSILFCGPQYDYGDQHRGDSIEDLHMVRVLQDMGVQVTRFDFRELMIQHSLPIMNEMLRTEMANDPDIIIYVPFEGMEITDDTWLFAGDDTVTVLWLFNDSWRFAQLGQELCWMFDWVVSDSPDAVEHYDGILYDGDVVYMPRAVRTKWFTGPELERDIDVAFIGQSYGSRPDVLRALADTFSDLNLKFRMPDDERLAWPDYINVFKRSKIGLSFGQPSQGEQAQIKMRDFEVTAAGAMLLTDNFGINDVFDGGEEAIVFSGFDDLAKKIDYFIQHSDVRERVAQAGNVRTLAMHDYRHRFEQLFKKLGVVYE